jgi:hypothetical protein
MRLAPDCTRSRVSLVLTVDARGSLVGHIDAIERLRERL